MAIVRDPHGQLDDASLFTTDLRARVAGSSPSSPGGLIAVLFRASKQVLDIEEPQHYSQAAVEKVAPWVWSWQSLLMVWYLTAGRELPEAEELRDVMGAWDSEWSLRHMMAVLRRATLNGLIKPKSAEPTELLKLLEALKNCVNLAV